MTTRYILGNGSTELENFPTYDEAKDWLDRYTRHDFGGWDFISIVFYDATGARVVEYEGDAPDEDIDA